ARASPTRAPTFQALATAWGPGDRGPRRDAVSCPTARFPSTGATQGRKLDALMRTRLELTGPSRRPVGAPWIGRAACPGEGGAVGEALQLPSERPPGPGSAIPVLAALAVRRDPLRFLTHAARTYGDLAHLQVGPRHDYLVNRPEWIRDVLLAPE